MVLVSPQKCRARTIPKFRERSGGLEEAWSIRKLSAIPQVPAGFVQNAYASAEVKVQSRSLMILSVDHHYIARLITSLNCGGKLLRRKDWRERDESRVHTGQQRDHHYRQNYVSILGLALVAEP